MDFVEKFTPLLRKILSEPDIHVKWLNTLSFLENCGARKIAACEHKTLVREEMLKHAAEEFRHAHDLKRQLIKITSTPPETYGLSTLLGGMKTLHYLHALDLQVCRIIKAHTLPISTSYILTTYAIEMRAQTLYPLYHQLLKESGSKISVRSILLEEEEHLAQMREQLKLLPEHEELEERVCEIEEKLSEEWLEEIQKNN
jgi:hypothetical protein